MVRPVAQTTDFFVPSEGETDVDYSQLVNFVFPQTR